MNGDSHSIEQWKRDLTAAGWVAESSTVWRAPDGGLWRGPAGAWKELQRRAPTQTEGEQKPRPLTAEELIDIERFQRQRRGNAVPADAWLYVAEIDRLLGHIRAEREQLENEIFQDATDPAWVPAAAPSATAAPKCVKCFHMSGVTPAGQCAAVSDSGYHFCGCKCEFAEPVTTTTAQGVYASVIELCERKAAEYEAADRSSDHGDVFLRTKAIAYRELARILARGELLLTRCGECDQVIEGTRYCFNCIQVLKEKLLAASFPATGVEAGGDEERVVCDCHTWPTIAEMHNYVEVLERIVRGTRPEVRDRTLLAAMEHSPGSEAGEPQ